MRIYTKKECSHSQRKIIFFKKQSLIFPEKSGKKYYNLDSKNKSDLGTDPNHQNGFFNL